jgi:hypothetical protein
MARPIEKTPVIKGEDAQRFRESLRRSLMPSFSASELARKKRELQEMKDSYNVIVAASDGAFY